MRINLIASPSRVPCSCKAKANASICRQRLGSAPKRGEESANCRFEFEKRRQPFTRTHHEMLCVVAACARSLFAAPSRHGHGRNGQRQHYSEKAGLAREGQRFNKFKCTLRRRSLPLFASNGFPVLTEIGHRLVALFVVLCLPAIVTILCGFDRVAVARVVSHLDHVAT